MISIMALNNMSHRDESPQKKTSLSQRILAAEIAMEKGKSKHFPTFEKASNGIKALYNPQMVFDEQKLRKKAEIDKQNDIERNDLRRGFLDTFGVNLNPDDPAEDKMKAWSWDKRYSTANIISPEGFCYVLKVNNNKEYMEAFSIFMEKLGVKQTPLDIFNQTDNPDLFTELGSKMDALEEVNLEQMIKYTPKRLRK